jgi:diguanylate cyclase (GGDEF)-like protein
MVTSINLEVLPSSSPAFIQMDRTRRTGILFAALMTAQAIGFLTLGTGRWGCALSELILCVEGLLAFHCSRIAYRRAQGIAALFWSVFAIVLLVLLVPTALQAYNTLFGQTAIPEAPRNLLYCLYGAPVLMMLFLPETHRERVKSEIFLDLFQVGIVVGLVYSTFFFLPERWMLPADATLRTVNISDVQSSLLLIAVLVRLQFASVPGSRDLLLRLGSFLLICAVATFIGDWIYVHFQSPNTAWVDLGWSVPQVVAGLIAITWVPAAQTRSVSDSAKFGSYLATNLVLVTMLCSISVLMDRWKQAYGAGIADAAIAASLVAFTFRLALTQFSQQQEIAQRKMAQNQLTISNQKIGCLLDSARQQTAEITQISELGSVLHATYSREEVYRLIPERLRRLFPAASGCVVMMSTSKNRVESVAEWGVLCPAGQVFAPQDCWALRRGRVHTQSDGASMVRCSHLRGEGPSVCVPLIANGDTIGVLIIQNDDPPIAASDAGTDADSDSFDRRRDVAATVAEHISLAIANQTLREALRSQAIRDGLTGLYNRRYMQEFLERELHAARRKHRSVAVIMIDLDHFKRYNDNFGHAAGDLALKATGEMLLRSVRAEDIACRYGGEEFCLILPECSLRQAAVRAETIQRRLQEYRGESNGQPTSPLTMSIGIAAFDETTDRVDLLFKFADDALYQAKRSGRNQVVTAHPAVALPEPAEVSASSAEVHWPPLL